MSVITARSDVSSSARSLFLDGVAAARPGQERFADQVAKVAGSPASSTSAATAPTVAAVTLPLLVVGAGPGGRPTAAAAVGDDPFVGAASFLLAPAGLEAAEEPAAPELGALEPEDNRDPVDRFLEYMSKPAEERMSLRPSDDQDRPPADLPRVETDRRERHVERENERRDQQVAAPALGAAELGGKRAYAAAAATGALAQAASAARYAGTSAPTGVDQMA